MRPEHKNTLFLARNFSFLEGYTWQELNWLAEALDLYNRFEAMRRELKPAEKTDEMRWYVGFLRAVRDQARFESQPTETLAALSADYEYNNQSFH
jgi:hypothetical protein